MNFHYAEHGAVAVLRMDRPEAMNAIDPPLAAALIAAVDAVEASPLIRAAVLTGTGRFFCAGADVATFAAGRTGEVGTADGGFAGFTFRRRTKPFIAAVNGVAAAGGCELALACELVLACPEASFSLPVVNVGLVAAAGGLARLPAAVGSMVANDMLLTGEAITGERAYQLGLASRLLPADKLLAEAVRVATVIAGNAPISIRESVATTRVACRLDDREILARQDEARRVCWESEDAIEGPQAFLAKRAPKWKGL